MKFEKVLFAIVEDYISENALSEALKLVQKLESDYEILFILPDFPRKAEKLIDAYKENITNKLTAVLQKCKSNKADHVDAIVTFVSGKPYAKNITDYANKNKFDLVVKLADQNHDEQANGYQALDVTLIRRSVIPVLFINHDLHRIDTQIFVAIDPVADTVTAKKLNESLLLTADHMAGTYQNTIQILTCWHFENEAFMRESVFSKTSESEIDSIINEERLAHEKALNELIQSVELANPYEIHMHKGQADKLIPEIMKDHNDDILIMGTVGRTGLKGFLLGNTAENIFKQIKCSLLTLHPEK